MTVPDSPGCPRSEALRRIARDAAEARHNAAVRRGEPQQHFWTRVAEDLEMAQDWLASQLIYPGSTGERCAEIGAYGQCEFASGHALPHRVGDWQWVLLTTKS